jgi:hypothetical protein
MISDGTEQSANPAVAVDPSGVVHAVWQYRVGSNPEICYGSRDGAGWLTNRFLTHSTGKSEKPSLAADLFGRIHVVWTEYLLPEGNWEVFYKVWDPCNGSAGSPAIAEPGPRRMARISPNPCRGSVRVDLDLSGQTECMMSVYDIKGRLISRTAIMVNGPGEKTATWTGRDSSGADAPAGVYLLEISTGATRETQKIVLLR